MIAVIPQFGTHFRTVLQLRHHEFVVRDWFMKTAYAGSWVRTERQETFYVVP